MTKRIGRKKTVKKYKKPVKYNHCRIWTHATVHCECIPDIVNCPKHLREMYRFIEKQSVVVVVSIMLSYTLRICYYVRAFVVHSQISFYYYSFIIYYNLAKATKHWQVKTVRQASRGRPSVYLLYMHFC